ncbi:MAG: outer membrane beta-barrel protein [Bacteroidales bacterium]|nr:outer membrane beta-barrel protein [Bacteroidales bacterium]
MQRTKLTIVMLACLLAVGAASAQGKYRCPTFDLKKHQFGFGVSTTLLDNVGSFNQYLSNVGYNGYDFSLHTVQSSLFAIHFDYQYRFNDSWSIEAKLKYKRRHTVQTLSFVADGNYGLVGSLNSVYRDIAVPVTANFRWVTRAGSSFELFAGAGLTTLGLSVDKPVTIGFSDLQDTRADIGIEFDRGVDVYGVIGFQFEIPYGVFTLKPFVSFSYSPADNGRYSVTPVSPTTMIPSKVTSVAMHLCELECGLTMQF